MTRIREIHISLRRTLPAAVLCLAFAAAGIWIIGNVRAPEVLRLVGGWLNLLFFGGGGLVLLGSALLRRRRPLLVLSDEGLRCNEPLRPARETFFPWAIVEEFRKTEIFGEPYISVFTSDEPERRVSAGKFTRAAMRLNARFFGTPHSIAAGRLDCPPDELLRQLNACLAAYRRRDKSLRDDAQTKETQR